MKKLLPLTKLLKALLIILLICDGLTSCAQAKINVVKSYGFSRKSNRGTQMVDENHNPVSSPQTLQYIGYVETIPTTTEPTWIKAWVDNEAFDIYSEKVKAPELVGQTKNSQKIELKTKPGNTLWRLNLQQGNKEAIPEKYKSSTNISGIIIKGRYKNKDFFVNINSLVELSSNIYP